MKSNLSQVIYSANTNDLLSMILLQHIQEVLGDFNIIFNVDYLSVKTTCIITPVNKDGEPQEQIGVKLDKNFDALTSKNRDIYMVLLMSKIFYRMDERMYNYFSFSYFDENQYINLLMLSLSQSEQNLYHSKSNRDIFSSIIDMSIVNSNIIDSYRFLVDVKSIELILSDDLYRYIGYKLMNEPCKGMKNSYDEKTLYGYPFKISVDNNSYLDFFMIKINDFKIYRNIIDVKMEPSFYLPLHIFEPISCTKNYGDSELLRKGSTLFNHQDFIQLTIERIFQSIDLLNSAEDIISPIWIKSHQKSLSLPFSEKLLSLNYSTRKRIA